MSTMDMAKKNIMTPFIAAFAGMVLAIPVAVTVSVMAVKATIGNETAQLAHAVSTLTEKQNKVSYMTSGDAVATTTQGGGNIVSCADTEATHAHAAHSSVGAVYAIPTGYGAYHTKPVVKAVAPAHVTHTTNNTSHTEIIKDSYNTVGSHNKELDVKIDSKVTTNTNTDSFNKTTTTNTHITNNTHNTTTTNTNTQTNTNTNTNTNINNNTNSFNNNQLHKNSHNVTNRDSNNTQIGFLNEL